MPRSTKGDFVGEKRWRQVKRLDGSILETWEVWNGRYWEAFTMKDFHRAYGDVKKMTGPAYLNHLTLLSAFCNIVEDEWSKMHVTGKNDT
jgi:hypothetical protein